MSEKTEKPAEKKIEKPKVIWTGKTGLLRIVRITDGEAPTHILECAVGTDSLGATLWSTFSMSQHIKELTDGILDGLAG